MPTVEEIAAEIVAREGGYVDDPADPGGPTKYGVTLATMKRLGIDLTGDGRVDAADVQRLTKGRAVEIFVAHYFRRSGISRLPAVLQPSVFDMYVNAGASAVRILQRLLTEMGFPCDDDGVIGPRTEAQAQAAARAAPSHIADAYAIARRNYYFRLADARPASRKYARARDGGKGGWIRRAESFMAPRYRMSAAEFRERTAAWA